MMHRTSAVARVSAPPSRAGPSLLIHLVAMMLALAILALSIAATAGAQTVKLQRSDSLAPAVPRTDSNKAAADSAASAAKAAAALPKWFDDLAVNAFVSTAYEYNSNRPTTGTNSYRVFDFNDNSFNLDVAELVVQIAASKPNDAGFRVDFDAGNSIPQITKTQDQTAAQFDLKQAFASYIAPIGSGLRVDVGKFVTHLGYEVIEGYDGYNDNHTKRNVFDVVAVLKATNWLTLGVNGDYGIEDGTSRVNPGSDAKWKGIAGYAVLALTDKFSVGLRGETFHDDGGVRLGTDTRATLSEGTLTPTYKFTGHVLVRGEVRFDAANQPILAKRGTLSDKQTTVAANVIFVY